MRYDRTHLELHRRKWRVRVAVPKELKATIGKPHIVVALGTESLSEAARLKHSVIARIRQSFEEARSGASATTLDIIDEALTWKEQGVIDLATGERNDELTEMLLVERAEQLESSEFLDMARGDATPLLPLVSRWLDERVSMKPRQKHDYRREVTKYLNEVPTLEQASRKRVGEYVSTNFIQKGIHPRTTNKAISCLSSFWRWLIKRGHAVENPWLGQGVNDRDLEVAQIKKRPFEDTEVKKLVKGTAEGTMLGDAIRIAALSGMRVSEIAKLRVKDVVGATGKNPGCFNVIDAKTKAGNRKVPVHSALKGVLKARLKSKSPDDLLFHELPAIKPGSAVEPGQAITKHFGRLRVKLGVDEKTEGARQSNVDFHSFRRWFITKAEMAGQPPHVISAVVGHERQGITLGVYSGGPSEEQMREVVEAVKLPADKPATKQG